MSKLLIAVVASLFLLGCVGTEANPTFGPPAVQCPQDAMVCPDGTAVGRVGPDCEFAACPEPSVDACVCTKEFKPVCGEDGVTYGNACEAGCAEAEVIYEGECEAILEPFPCSEESRNAGACIELHDPVCGWFDESINCLVYPCASTYSNSCFACMDEDVAYYTQGECPSPG